MLLFKRDWKESNAVPTPGLIGYNYVSSLCVPGTHNTYHCRSTASCSILWPSYWSWTATTLLATARQGAVKIPGILRLPAACTARTLADSEIMRQTGRCSVTRPRAEMLANIPKTTKITDIDRQVHNTYVQWDMLYPGVYRVHNSDVHVGWAVFRMGVIRGFQGNQLQIVNLSSSCKMIRRLTPQKKLGWIGVFVACISLWQAMGIMLLHSTQWHIYTLPDRVVVHAYKAMIVLHMHF